MTDQKRLIIQIFLTGVTSESHCFANFCCSNFAAYDATRLLTDCSNGVMGQLNHRASFQRRWQV